MFVFGCVAFVLLFSFQRLRPAGTTPPMLDAGNNYVVIEIVSSIAPELAIVMVLWLIALFWWSKTSWWGHYAKNFPLSKSTLVRSVNLYHSGGGGYHGTFRIGATNEGLLLKAYFAFRPFHPPILIPWGIIESINVKSVLGALSKNKIGSAVGLLNAKIIVKGENDNPITVSWNSELGSSLEEASNKRN